MLLAVFSKFHTEDKEQKRREEKYVENMRMNQKRSKEQAGSGGEGDVEKILAKE